MIHQNKTINDTVYFWFAANDTSGSGGDGATPLFDVRKAGVGAAVIPILSGTPTLLTHADYPAGCHEIAVAATTGNGFAADDTFAVFCTLAIDSQNPSGFVGSCTLTPLAKASICTEARLSELASANIPANIDTLLTRLSAARAGYLDNLSAGAAALASALATLDGKVDDVQGATFNTSTDSLEAIRDRGDAAWTTGAGGTPPQLLQSTTIATLASQTSFTLTAGSADNDAYFRAMVVVTDQTTSEQKAVGFISGYTGSSRTVTLYVDPGIFAMAIGDFIDVIAVNTEGVWSDNLVTYINGQAGKRLKGLSAATVVDGTVNDLSATTISFITTLTGYGTDFFVDTEIAVEIATDQWQPRVVTAYNTTTGLITIDEALISAPSDGSNISLTMRHIHSISAINAEMDTAISDANLATEAKQDTSETKIDSVQTTATAIEVDTQNIQSRLPAALVSGKMDSDAVAVGGSTDGATRLGKATQANVYGTIGSGSTTTSLVTSALDPSAAAADQFKGKIVTFDANTTTANLRGQSTDITANTSGGVLTVTALTTAAVSEDTFVIT